MLFRWSKIRARTIQPFKTMNHKSLGLFSTLACLLSLIPCAQAVTATFTNTPAAVSNTYSGILTLQIGGLTNRETVVVQKFADLNTNGVIDGADWLVQQFTLTDGTNSVIGGVTNFNVPGDLNATTGAITAQLNFQNGDFVQNIAGHYLFKLSSPTGHFPAVTNGFTVTNFPYAQKFTGNVVSNNTGTTLSNAIVLLFPPPRSGNDLGQPLAGAVANNSGTYTIPAPPGTYSLMAFKTNYVTSYKKAPTLVLGSGSTVTTNLSVTNATASITGKVVDAANTSLGLPAVFTGIKSTNGWLAVCTTDTNGNFIARVTAGSWSLGGDDSGLIVHGYVGWNNSTNVNAGASGVTLAYTKANALIYGNISDNLGNPLAGIDVYGNDSNSNLYSMDGFTDRNGNYVVAAVGTGPNDTWYVQANGNNQLTNYVFTQSTIDGNLSAGQAELQNFTAIPGTSLLTGKVTDSGNHPLVGLGVYANATINNTNYQAGNAYTDTNGIYYLLVPAGYWTVGVNCNGGNDSLDGILGNGNYACPTGQSVNVSGASATNNLIVQLCGGVSITTPPSLPVGEVNLGYDQFIQASSCSGNYNWSQTGGNLPDGLSLNPNGNAYELFGTPTTNGIFTFTVQVNDGTHTTNQQFTLAISNAVQITTSVLPNGTNGSAYSQPLQLTGGQPPYLWLIFSGSLPANLNLSTNGLLSGTAATNGTYYFTAGLTDNLGGTASQPLALTLVTTNIVPAPPVGIAAAGGQLLIYYPLSGSNNVLMTAPSLSGPWVPATGGVPVTALTFSNSASAQFFRLQ